MREFDDPDPDKRQAVVQFTADGTGSYGLTGAKLQTEWTFEKFTAGQFKKSNQVEIRSVNGQIEVAANGVTVARFGGPQLSAGHIGLHVKHGSWQFSNLQIRELHPDSRLDGPGKLSAERGAIP
jgi:hypothetical protein